MTNFLQMTSGETSMKKLITYSILSLFLFVSCAPEPVFRLSPRTDNTTFHRGVEYIQYEQDGLILSMGYYRHTGNQFIMDVEIINESDSVVFTDPTMFKYEAYDQTRNSFSRESVSFLSYSEAFDPEKQMLALDLQLESVRASENTDQALFLIGQTLSIASEITADSPEARERISEQRHETYIEQQYEEEEFDYAKMSLAERRKVWELDALRKTHLFPGDYIRGLVFFENQPDAGVYILYADDLFPGFDALYLQRKYIP